jgi:hypothetical protein
MKQLVTIDPPSRGRWWLAGLCGAGAAAAVWFAWSVPPVPPAPADTAAPGAAWSARPTDSIAAAVPAVAESDVSPADIQRLSAQIVELQQAVRSLREQMAARRPAAPVAGASADAAAAQDPASAKEAERAQADEQAAAIEQRFRQETVNPGWSGTATAAVKQALMAGAGDEALAVRALECRGQTCRIDIGSDVSNDSLQRVLGRIGGTFGSLAAMPSLQPGGGTIVYLSR